MATMVKRTYTDFAGVDFSNNSSLVQINRSPDSLNVWKNYEGESYIGSRPGVRKITTIGTKINGIYMFNSSTAIVHSGTGLYVWDNFPDEPNNLQQIYSNMNVNNRSVFNKFGEYLYINDGTNYLKYDGTTLSQVTTGAFIPTTTIGRKPSGGGEMYQDVNVLQPKRINQFLADGTSTVYVLDATGIDSVDKVIVNDVETTNYTVNITLGTVTFNTAPPEPSLSGKDNVYITFSKTILGYSDRIKHCTKALMWDNRMFYTGNPSYPNAIFHSELNNPGYISDLSYYEDGASDSAIKDFVVGSNVLWVFKDHDQNNANVFYHTKEIDSEQGAIYPCNKGNVQIGCYSSAINFQDDIVYLSKEGLEGIITENLNNRQVVALRSSNINPKMINDTNYYDAQMEEWKGYLLILIGNKIFLADSRQKFSNLGSFEYEWYYWILDKNPNVLKEYNGNLYIGAKDGSIFIVEGTNDDGTAIESYWTTPMDNFGYENHTKTTNKRGGIAKLKTMQNGVIKVATKTDKEPNYTYITKKILTGFKFTNINFGEFSFGTTMSRFLIYKIKRKKIKEISIKVYSDELNKPFGLYSLTLEAFVGGYVKR